MIQLNLFAPAIRWTSLKAIERSGFRWSLRRSGDLKIGMWRKKLHKDAGKRGSTSKRFVLTPGYGDSPVSWLLVVALLGPALKRAGFDEVVMLDFPGFNGKLLHEKCIPSMELLLAAVADVYDWLEPDTILGHSLGGWLTAHYALECGAGARPKNRKRHGYEGPKQVVLVAAAGVYESVEVRDSINKIFQDLVGESGFPVLRPHLFAKEPVWFGWVVEGFSHFVKDASVRQFTLSIKEDQLIQDRLHLIKARTWLVWGDRDTLVPVGGISRWLEGLSATECDPHALLIKGVGHSPQLEKPAVTAALLTRILLGQPVGQGRQKSVA